MPCDLEHTSAEVSAMSRASALHRTRLQKRQKERKNVWRSSTYTIHWPPACKRLHVPTILDPVSCFFFHACKFFYECSPAMLPSDQHVAHARSPPDVKRCFRRITYVLLHGLRRQKVVHMQNGGRTIIPYRHRGLFTRATATSDRGMDEWPALWMS